MRRRSAAAATTDSAASSVASLVYGAVEDVLGPTPALPPATIAHGGGDGGGSSGGRDASASMVAAGAVPPSPSSSWLRRRERSGMPALPPAPSSMMRRAAGETVGRGPSLAAVASLEAELLATAPPAALAAAAGGGGAVPAAASGGEGAAAATTASEHRRLTRRSNTATTTVGGSGPRLRLIPGASYRSCGALAAACMTALGSTVSSTAAAMPALSVTAAAMAGGSSSAGATANAITFADFKVVLHMLGLQVGDSTAQQWWDGRGSAGDNCDNDTPGPAAVVDMAGLQRLLFISSVLMARESGRGETMSLWDAFYAFSKQVHVPRKRRGRRKAAEQAASSLADIARGERAGVSSGRVGEPGHDNGMRTRSNSSLSMLSTASGDATGDEGGERDGALRSLKTRDALTSRVVDAVGLHALLNAAGVRAGTDDVNIAVEEVLAARSRSGGVASALTAQAGPAKETGEPIVGSASIGSTTATHFTLGWAGSLLARSTARARVSVLHRKHAALQRAAEARKSGAITTSVAGWLASVLYRRTGVTAAKARSHGGIVVSLADLSSSSGGGDGSNGVAALAEDADDGDADGLINMGVSLTFEEVVAVWAARVSARAEIRRYQKLLRAMDGTPVESGSAGREEVAPGASPPARPGSTPAAGTGDRDDDPDARDSEEERAAAPESEGEGPAAESAVGRAASAASAVLGRFRPTNQRDAAKHAAVAVTRQQQLSRLVLEHAARSVDAVRKAAAAAQREQEANGDATAAARAIVASPAVRGVLSPPPKLRDRVGGHLAREAAASHGGGDGSVPATVALKPLDIAAVAADEVSLFEHDGSGTAYVGATAGGGIGGDGVGAHVTLGGRRAPAMHPLLGGAANDSAQQRARRQAALTGSSSSSSAASGGATAASYLDVRARNHIAAAADKDERALKRALRAALGGHDDSGLAHGDEEGSPVATQPRGASTAGVIALDGAPASPGSGIAEVVKQRTSREEDAERERSETLMLANRQLEAVPPSLFGSADAIRALRLLLDVNMSDNKLQGLPDAAFTTALIAMQRLDLSFNLLPILPREVRHWRQLRVLNVANNALKSLPEELGELQMLMVLDASSNQLTVIPAAIATCSSLAVLRVSHNGINALPEALWTMRSLRELAVANNGLRYLSRDIAGLTSLEVLDVSNNTLFDLPDEVAGCSRLRSISVAHNRLRELPGTFDALRELQSLDVSHNELRYLPTTLKRCRKLLALQASHNQLLALDPALLHRCWNLQRLDLSHNLLETLPPTVGYCIVLQELLLGNNRLRSLPTELAACRSLRTLNLRCNRLGSVPVEAEPVEVAAKVRLPPAFVPSLGDDSVSLAGGSDGGANADDGTDSVRSAAQSVGVGVTREHYSPVVPPSLAVLSCLRWLDISFNEALVLTPELGLCPQLAFVNASHNRFTDVAPTFCRSPSIVALDLSFNRLRYISDDVGGNMRSLETLDVSCNLLERLPDSLGRCSTLRHIFASGNRLLNVPSTMGPLMTVLQTFDVSNNPMSELPPILPWLKMSKDEDGDGAGAVGALGRARATYTKARQRFGDVLNASSVEDGAAVSPTHAHRHDSPLVDLDVVAVDREGAADMRMATEAGLMEPSEVAPPGTPQPPPAAPPDLLRFAAWLARRTVRVQAAQRRQTQEYDYAGARDTHSSLSTLLLTMAGDESAQYSDIEVIGGQERLVSTSPAPRPPPHLPSLQPVAEHGLPASAMWGAGVTPGLPDEFSGDAYGTNDGGWESYHKAPADVPVPSSGPPPGQASSLAKYFPAMAGSTVSVGLSTGGGSGQLAAPAALKISLYTPLQQAMHGIGLNLFSSLLSSRRHAAGTLSLSQSVWTERAGPAQERGEEAADAAYEGGGSGGASGAHGGDAIDDTASLMSEVTASTVPSPSKAIARWSPQRTTYSESAAREGHLSHTVGGHQRHLLLGLASYAPDAPTLQAALGTQSPTSTDGAAGYQWAGGEAVVPFAAAASHPAPTRAASSAAAATASIATSAAAVRSFGLDLFDDEPLPPSSQRRGLLQLRPPSGLSPRRHSREHAGLTERSVAAFESGGDLRQRVTAAHVREGRVDDTGGAGILPPRVREVSHIVADGSMMAVEAVAAAAGGPRSPTSPGLPILTLPTHLATSSRSSLDGPPPRLGTPSPRHGSPRHRGRSNSPTISPGRAGAATGRDVSPGSLEGSTSPGREATAEVDPRRSVTFAPTPRLRDTFLYSPGTGMTTGDGEAVAAVAVVNHGPHRNPTVIVERLPTQSSRPPTRSRDELSVGAVRSGRQLGAVDTVSTSLGDARFTGVGGLSATTTSALSDQLALAVDRVAAFNSAPPGVTPFGVGVTKRHRSRISVREVRAQALNAFAAITAPGGSVTRGYSNADVAKYAVLISVFVVHAEAEWYARGGVYLAGIASSHEFVAHVVRRIVAEHAHPGVDSSFIAAGPHAGWRGSAVAGSHAGGIGFAPSLLDDGGSVVDEMPSTAMQSFATNSVDSAGLLPRALTAAARGLPPLPPARADRSRTTAATDSALFSAFDAASTAKLAHDSLAALVGDVWDAHLVALVYHYYTRAHNHGAPPTFGEVSEEEVARRRAVQAAVTAFRDEIRTLRSRRSSAMPAAAAAAAAVPLDVDSLRDAARLARNTMTLTKARRRVEHLAKLREEQADLRVVLKRRAIDVKARTERARQVAEEAAEAQMLSLHKYALAREDELREAEIARLRAAGINPAMAMHPARRRADGEGGGGGASSAPKDALQVAEEEAAAWQKAQAAASVPDVAGGAWADGGDRAAVRVAPKHVRATLIAARLALEERARALVAAAPHHR